MRRLFFGVEIRAPWPDNEPKGRLIGHQSRHMTLAFLGNVEEAPKMEGFPQSPVAIGPAGLFDEPLFLRNVLAYHVKWLGPDWIGGYAKKVQTWLGKVDRREWTPHVTVARKPYEKKEWKKAFVPLPVLGGSIHLYESTGNLHYEPIWTLALKWPIEYLDHTADVGFLVRGENLEQLFQNAQIAMAFECPRVLDYLVDEPVSSLDEIVGHLNGIIARMDIEEGSPFKAVSYSGDYVDGEWEMIIDV